MSKKDFKCLVCGNFFSVNTGGDIVANCPVCNSEKVELILLDNNKGCCSDKDSCDIRCKPVEDDKPSCSCGGNC